MCVNMRNFRKFWDNFRKLCKSFRKFRDIFKNSKNSVIFKNF